MKKLTIVLTGVLAAAFALASIASVGAQAATGTVTVIHGVPGLTVDVYVNGDLTLEDFAPDTVTDPLELPEGDYDLEIFAANADPNAGEPAITGSTTLPGGANASIIAHLAEDGTPMLSVFVNDTSDIASGSARLVVRHTAAAPAVDVLANGDALFANLANPDEAKADVPAGSYSAAVAATGTTTPVIGPTDLKLDAGTEYIVYAVGSLDASSLKVLVQTISGLGAPASGSLPAAGFGPGGNSTNPSLWIALGLGVLGVAFVGGSAAAAKVRNR